MFQTFEATTTPDQGPPRLAALRAAMADEGLAGFLVPRADAHRGEYVAPCDERLAWLTGFTGSAGFAAVLADRAGVFVDGRYKVQVKAQVAGDFTPVAWPETKLGVWLKDALPKGGKVGYDAWLHTKGWLEAVEKDLNGSDVSLVPTPNLVDRIWDDRPPRPAEPVRKYPKAFAGLGDETKRARIAETLQEDGHKSAVLTLPDSICWLLNIRGADVRHTPLVHAFAIIHDDATVTLFSDPEKFESLGPDPDIDLRRWDDFEAALAALDGPVRLDKYSAPLAVAHALESAGVEIAWADDPCALPKARKTGEEIAATRDAHLRDATAMVEFLAWLDAEAEKVIRDPGHRLTEVDVAQNLEGHRRATNALQEISFDTIAGSGPNGAIVHYRVTEDTNRALRPGELLLVDSGGQYLDGTTDITRTIAIGAPAAEHIACFTRVLRGMIAVSRLRWPQGLAGRDLDAVARYPLWLAGQDYDHGTGHGVGVFLGVHEGPQRLSKISEVPLEAGMILSNEPGYYREGAFGIRIENLVVVQNAAKAPGGDDREMLAFETLTWVPIDHRLIDPEVLCGPERDWLNAYHAEVLEKVAPRVGPHARAWLEAACAPI